MPNKEIRAQLRADTAQAKRDVARDARILAAADEYRAAYEATSERRDAIPGPGSAEWHRAWSSARARSVIAIGALINAALDRP